MISKPKFDLESIEMSSVPLIEFQANDENICALSCFNPGDTYI